MKPVKTVKIRNIDCYVMSETYNPSEFYCPGDIKAARMLIPAKCYRPKADAEDGYFANCSLISYNVMYQFVRDRDEDVEFNDDRLIGHFETNVEVSEFGFTDEEVEAFIETLID